MVLDNDGNMILTEDLILQEEKIWKKFLEKRNYSRGKDVNSCELYFEEREDRKFVLKNWKICILLIQYVNRLTTHSWGQKVKFGLISLDGNLTEVWGTPDVSLVCEKE